MPKRRYITKTLIWEENGKDVGHVAMIKLKGENWRMVLNKDNKPNIFETAKEAKEDAKETAEKWLNNA